jgi:IS1 family transposase
MALFRDVAERVGPENIPLITTDGFEFYERVVWQVFGPACVYGQVLKTRRNNRIVKVERRTVIGTEGRLEEKLQRSEDSSTLNTSFIERLNLTIRQGSAYLCRRTICHARWRQRLDLGGGNFTRTLNTKERLTAVDQDLTRRWCVLGIFKSSRYFVMLRRRTEIPSSFNIWATRLSN